MPIEIRPVRSDADRDAVFRLRYQIYVDEMGYHYPSADHVCRMLPDEPGRSSRLLLAADGDAVVGTIKIDCGRDGAFSDEERAVYQLARFEEIVPVERMAVFSRFMTAPAYRSGEVAPRLMAAMIELLLEIDAQLLFCDCRPHLISSYERLGFRTYASVYSDSVAGILAPLVMVLDDLPHLEQVRSRIAPIIQARPRDRSVAQRITPLLPAATPVHSVEHVEEWRDWPDVSTLLSRRGEQGIALFEGIGEADVARLIELSHVIECHAGDRIVTHDNVDRTIFVVLDGTVEAQRDGQSIRVMGRGSVFGEISFLLREARSADVVAVSNDVRVLALRERTLAELIESASDVAARLLLNLSRILAERLAHRG